MFNSSIGSSAQHFFTPTRFAPSHSAPQATPSTPKPFSNPDVFCPTFPSNPEGQPLFPSQPVWLPPTPSLPNVEVPFQFPIELPTLPDENVFKQLPTPNHFPDWSKQPLELPHPFTPEIREPKKDPAEPVKAFPPGTWLLS